METFKCCKTIKKRYEPFIERCGHNCCWVFKYGFTGNISNYATKRDAWSRGIKYLLYLDIKGKTYEI